MNAWVESGAHLTYLTTVSYVDTVTWQQICMQGPILDPRVDHLIDLLTLAVAVT
jgi:hypothetical protein